ncbi:hypothetical protein AURANDRAFT_67995 [Aureococcus anophagefferens]|uniref:Uncharacterized protein n=1 Tax=Aureococcus anophagefferens TaxID=44056 RepID=F0YN60_AURAN|nr:hypothetical protein AURANDRAFT_67995 [Aureococcus anophagefferens]EGB03446.1 hypothetical protein AURANDRAFT_67995 [Aureococcus anophagefferens]|eukprot:XP_009041845.1 hypothetical protein AURANDRAFT_67995 [Aureococcus anophagefferens]
MSTRFLFKATGAPNASPTNTHHQIIYIAVHMIAADARLTDTTQIAQIQITDVSFRTREPRAGLLLPMLVASLSGKRAHRKHDVAHQLTRVQTCSQHIQIHMPCTGFVSLVARLQ